MRYFLLRVTLISGLDTGFIETCACHLDQRDVTSTKEQSWQPKSQRAIRDNGDGIALMNERLIYDSASLRTTMTMVRGNEECRA